MATLTLKNIKTEASDCKTFIFSAQSPISWVAGQYLRITLPHDNPDDRGINRYFSIASSPTENQIQITTRFAPKSSSLKQKLQTLKVGDSFEAQGPMGNFTLENPQAEYIFIAGGIGITPFRAIIHDLNNKGQKLPITLLYANRNNEIVFQEELETVRQTHPEFNIEYIIEPNRVDETKIKSLANYQNKIYYLSGPEPMIKAIKELLLTLSISEDQIKTDFFPGYTQI